MTSEEVAGQHGMRDHLDRGKPATDRAPGLHAALTALAEKWETEAAHPTGHSLLVQVYGNLAREVRALLAEHPATPDPVAGEESESFSKIPSASPATVFCASRNPEPPHQECEQGNGHDGRHRDFPTNPRVAETYWTDAPAPEPSDRAGLSEKWLSASDAARKAEHHFPADCLAEAATVVVALADRLAVAEQARDEAQARAVEPGSQIEFNPDCPKHGTSSSEPATKAEPSDRAGLSAEELRDVRAAFERDRWAGEFNSLPTAIDRVLSRRAGRLAVAEQGGVDDATLAEWRALLADELCLCSSASTDLRALDDHHAEIQSLRAQVAAAHDLADLWDRKADENERHRASAEHKGDRRTLKKLIRHQRMFAHALRAALGDPGLWVDRLKAEGAAEALSDLADAIDSGDVNHDDLRRAGVDELAPLGWADASVIAAYDVAPVWTSLLRARARVLRGGEPS